jgi:hypothetical protein
VRLAIGIILAHGFPAPSEFWLSLFRVLESIRRGEGGVTALRLIHSTAFPTDVARNEIVRVLLDESEADALLFLDADMTHPPDIAARLLAHNQPVVTGRYHMRRPPYHVVAYVKHRTLTHSHAYAPVHVGRGLIEIERGGAGALLIRREVLERIRARIGDNWFRYQRGPKAPHDYTVSEDFWFYQQARAAGARCYLDWDCECQHLQLAAIDGAWQRAYLQAQLDALAGMTPEARQRVADNLVVCGYPEGLRLPTGEWVPPYQVTEGER